MPDEGVTIVVPTLNRGPFLLDCLRDLAAQENRRMEILVVDQSAETPFSIARFVAEHRQLVHYRRVDCGGLPQARNYGWQHARFDAIVFVDDDIRCGPRLASEHLRALQLPGVGLVAGRVRGSGSSGAEGRFCRWTATPEPGFDSPGEHGADHARGCNFSIWRHAAAAVGGFDERLAAGTALYEDCDFSLRVKRAGFRVYFNGRAEVTHRAAPAGGCRVDKLPQYVRSLARNRAVLIRRHLEWFRRPPAVLRLALLCASYALRYREAAALTAAVAGCREGFRVGELPPLCGRYGSL